MSEELKPCPCCGKDDDINESIDLGDNYLECGYCSTSTPVGNWNNRASEAEVERLRTENDKLKSENERMWYIVHRAL